MDRLEILETSKRLIKRGWCKHALAEDETGRTVRPESAEAQKYCLIGSIQAQFVSAEPDVKQSEIDQTRRLLERFTPGNAGLAQFNDKSSSVIGPIRLLNKAIKFVKERRKGVEFKL